MGEASLLHWNPKHPFRAADSVSRFRLIFQKTEDLIFLSHIDLIRCIERIFRRADLPVRLAGKFHPMPRIIVALALPLGVHGIQEVLDVELTEPFLPNEILASLLEQSPRGLHFLSCQQVPAKASSRVIRLGYRFTIPADRLGAVIAKYNTLPPRGPWFVERCERRSTFTPVSGLVGMAEDGLESNNLEEWVGRSHPMTTSTTAPSGRVIDLFEITESLTFSGDALEAIFKFGDGGTGKPEEILRLLDAEDLVGQGERIERFLLEVAVDRGSTKPTPIAGQDPVEGTDQ